MKVFHEIYNTTKHFIKQLDYDHVGAYAAQSSFFVILSAFPILMLLLAILQYTPVTEQFLLDSIMELTPDNLDNLIEHVIVEMYHHSNITIVSLTALTALWSSSRAVLALIKGLNSVFGINENRNYFQLRVVATIYTIIFLLVIVFALGFMVFGNNILELLQLAQLFIELKMLYIPIVLTTAFIYLYKIVPNKQYSLSDHLPGAIFTSFGWIAFSGAYSFYIDNFMSSTYLYGSLTTVVLLMLWIYICMYILFIGAEINVQFKDEFHSIREHLRDL